MKWHFLFAFIGLYFYSATAMAALPTCPAVSPAPSNIGSLNYDSVAAQWKTCTATGWVAFGTMTLYAWSGNFTFANLKNYWSVGSPTFADFAPDGPPTLNQLYNSNFGTVSAAGSGLPGITFTAPSTGTIRTCAIPVSGWDMIGDIVNLQYIDSASSTVIAATGFWSASGASIELPETMCGFMNVTSGTSYTFKIRGYTVNGTTVYIGPGQGLVGPATPLSFTLEYAH